MSASFTSILVGLSSLFSGAKAIKEGIDGLGEQLQGLGINLGRANPALLPRGGEIRTKYGGFMPQSVRDLPPAGKLETKPVRKIEDNAKYIVDMIRKYGTDPRVRAYAGRILTRKCPGAAGEGKWCVAEKDWGTEVKTLYVAVRRSVRYTRDIEGLDTYQSPIRTLQMGIGDCFPVGTLVVTRDGLEEIQNLEIGDEIHDGEKWVRIVQTWVRGPKEILRAELNNGCSLRLSANHKVLRVPRIAAGNLPGKYEDAEEVLMGDLHVNDDLLQPRNFEAASSEEMDLDDAFLIGAYLAEGCRMKNSNAVSIAGVADGKGIRERVKEILEKKGVKYHEYEREVRFSVENFPFLVDYGRVSYEKHFPTFRYGPKTISTILHAMEMGDGGKSTSGTNMVYSTISLPLAVQYRVFQQMLGRSTSMKRVDDHGGFGKHPIYRVTVRNSDNEGGKVRRPWAKVKSISVEDEQVECVDVMTESGKVYLPQVGVITRQCDDYTILLGALLKSVGYPTRIRIVQTQASKSWDHIYLLVGLPPRAPEKWVSIDASLEAWAGWEVPKKFIVKNKDFVI